MQYLIIFSILVLTNGGKYAFIALRTCGRDTPEIIAVPTSGRCAFFVPHALSPPPRLYTLRPVCNRTDQGGPPLKRSESDICMPQDKQPAPLPPSVLPTPILDPNAALSKSPEMQDQLSHAEQVAAELSSMAAILSQVQNKESADAAADQLAPCMSRLRRLALKGDESLGSASRRPCGSCCGKRGCRRSAR